MQFNFYRYLKIFTVVWGGGGTAPANPLVPPVFMALLCPQLCCCIIGVSSQVLVWHDDAAPTCYVLLSSVPIGAYYRYILLMPIGEMIFCTPDSLSLQPETLFLNHTADFIHQE